MLRTFAKYCFAALLVVFSASLIINMKYSISLQEYLAYSVPLTREEQQFLTEQKTLRLAFDPKAAPISFVAEDGEEEKSTDSGLHGESGLLADYLSLLSYETGCQFEAVLMPASKQIESLKAGEIDAAVLFDENVNQCGYLATQPLYKAEVAIFVKYENAGIREYRDLQGRSLTIAGDSSLDGKITEVLPKGSSVDFVHADSMEAALQSLMKGETDALAGNGEVVKYYAEKLGIYDRLRQAGEPFYRGDAAVSVNVYNTSLYNVLNKVILKMKKENLFAGAQSKWFGNSASVVTDTTSVNWAQRIITFCVGVVILLMIWESVLNRRIEQKTREIRIQKNNLQTIIDNVNAMVAVLNEKDEITDCNERGRRMLGEGSGSFIGCGLGTVPMLRDLYAMHQARPKDAYYRYRGRDYSVYIGIISKKKRSRLLVIEDCTERTLAEKKLRQESKMIAVGQLSAGLAHEIRNPLGLIKNYAYILRDYVTDDMSKHSLDVIGESAGRIDSLVENLLRFSRLGGDETGPVNIEQLLQDVFVLEQKRLEKKKIRFSLSCAKNLTVRTRPEAVKMIVFNLINNAMDALSDEGAGGGRLAVSAGKENGFLQIAVKDDGPGMEEEVLENIFNPFFTTKDSGTGLGLYIVNSELEKLGGTIKVESVPDKGSIFAVKIPVEAEVKADE